MISLDKLKILTPLQKLTKNVGDLGKLIVAKGFKSCSKCKKSPNLVPLFLTSLYYLERLLRESSVMITFVIFKRKLNTLSSAVANLINNLLL